MEISLETSYKMENITILDIGQFPDWVRGPQPLLHSLVYHPILT